MSDEPEQEVQAGPVVKVARDLREILELHEALLTQAVHKASDHLMPGGLAMVSLASTANVEAWENMQQATERYGRAYTSVEDEDPDESWCAFQLLEFWSEQWRAVHGAEYGQRPTVKSEAEFIRWALDWAWDNEPHWDDFAADMALARTRLEATLLAGERSERGAPCMYDECRGERLVRKIEPKRDEKTKEKIWAMSDWHCPKCHRNWDEDRYAANVAAASESAKYEEINDEAWVSVDYAARKVDRPESTIRAWIHKEEISTACIIVGRRTRFVRLADVIERDEAKPRRFKTLTQEVEELERTDPEVKAAAGRLGEAVNRILHPEDYVMPENLRVS